MKIDELRNKIDSIDRKLVELLEDRTAAARKIGNLKKASRKSIYVPEREEAVYRKVLGYRKGAVPEKSLIAIYREVMSAARATEKELAIAYLGPEATFTHLAARKKFGGSVNYVAAASISDIFFNVEKGNVDYGVVPIENSIEGAVTHTLDMFIDSGVKICAEMFLAVSHYFLSNCAPEDVKKIYSKSEVFGQCRSWLRGKYPSAELVEASSTARAAEIAAKEKGAAALGSELAAEIYELKILEKGVEDTGRNETRFLIIGRNSAGPSGNDKTSIMVSIADRVGALYEMLYAFKENGINLTKIESRPSKRKAWDYYFFIDFIGHMKDKKVAGALDALKGHCLFVEHLGSYPMAR